MIKSKDLNKEIKILDDTAKAVDGDNVQVMLLRALVKGVGLVLKVIRDMKTNQVTALTKAYGKEVLVKQERREERKEEDK